MNRDNLHSASGGIGAVMPLVFVNPRPASDPGEDNSDLGSDAGWAYKMGSDSGDDQLESDVDIDGQSEVLAVSKPLAQDISALQNEIDVERFADKPDNSIVGSSVDQVDDNNESTDDAPCQGIYEEVYEDDGVADVDAIDNVAEDLDPVCALNDVNPVDYIDRKDLSTTTIIPTTAALADTTPGHSHMDYPSQLRHSRSEPSSKLSENREQSAIISYEDEEEDSGTLGMISLIHGYNGVSISTDKSDFDSTSLQRVAGVTQQQTESLASSRQTTPELQILHNSATQRPLHDVAHDEIEFVENVGARHGDSLIHFAKAAQSAQGSSASPGQLAQPQLPNVEGVHSIQSVLEDDDDEAFAPRHTSSSSQSSATGGQFSSSLRLTMREKTGKVGSIRRLTNSSGHSHQGSQRLAPNGILSHLHNRRVSRDRVGGSNRGHLRSGSENWGRPTLRNFRSGVDSSTQSSSDVRTTDKSTVPSSSAGAEWGPFWGPMLLSASQSHPAVSASAVPVASTRSVLPPLDTSVTSGSVSSMTTNTAGSSIAIASGSSPGLMAPSPATTEFSFLECVVAMLRGASCAKRKNIIMTSQTWIWLAPDMLTLESRTISRKCVTTERYLLSRVRRLRATDREISIVFDEKNCLDIVFRKRDDARTWLSGLCCLVPTRATVRSRYKHLEHRENYDPLHDSWNGKPLSSRKCFNEYILLGSIGRGAFGKVKLALSRETRQFYAVKVLSKAMMRKQNRNSAFDRVSHRDVETLKGNLKSSAKNDAGIIADISEIAIMKKLDHSNIVRMCGMYDDIENDRLYIVVEFVARGPVMNSSRLTGAEPMKESRAREVFLDVLAGMQYMHYNGVAHRDLKPENLLEAGDNSVKISDFGAAKYFFDDPSSTSSEAENSLQAQRTTVGTPAFTAPEHCLSEKSPQGPTKCFPADIWSLGATLYYMVYGRAPFLAKSVFEMYDFICTKPLEFPEYPETSKALQDLIQAMMLKCPEKRATFDTIFRSPWLQDHSESADRVSELLQVPKRVDFKVAITADDLSTAVVNATVKK